VKITANPYKYKYNGKELQDELGLNMYAMDFRQYHPAIGRWVVQDPITHHLMSPYVAFDNSPIFWSDPSGAAAEYNWDGKNKGKYTDCGKVVDFSAAMASYGLNTDGSESSNNGPGPGPVQSFNDWIFRNFTVNTPNWSPNNFPFDARGYEIFSHWTNGTGRDLNYNEGLWGDYMRDNDIINELLISNASALASAMMAEHKSTASEKSGNFHMEIQNGYFSGYELLHGTLYFSYEVTGKYNSKSKSYTFDYSLKWHDRINPNILQGDGPMADAYKGAKDYNITIKWTQSVQINSNDVKEYNVNNATTTGGRRGYRR